MADDTDLVKEGTVGRRKTFRESESTVDFSNDPAYINVEKKKRLFFNGSSYSGADIKVLVHRYDAGPQDLLADLELAISTYEQIRTKIDSIRGSTIPELESTIASYKTGAISKETYNDLFKFSWTNEVASVMSLEQNVGGTGYNQYIGRYLESLSVNVQQDPGAVSTELARTWNLLFDLTEGWKENKRAIEQRVKAGRFFQTKVLAELQTISVSTYREKSPVRSLGNANPKGYTRGTRTVAGSMIFTVFDRNVLFGLLDRDPSDFDADAGFSAAILDQLPPMDVTIIFANEYGSLSRMTIYGLEFVSEGQTMSIEDLILEDVVQWVARDVDPMTPVLDDDGEPFNRVLSNYNQAIALGKRPEQSTILRASDLVGSTWDSRDEEDTATTRFRNRYNPFF